LTSASSSSIKGCAFTEIAHIAGKDATYLSVPVDLQNPERENILNKLLKRTVLSALMFMVYGPLCAQTAPTINSISPRWGALGTAVSVTLKGTGFSDPMTVNAGMGAFGSLGIGNVSVVNSSLATATINLPAGTTGGISNITVTTSAGTSNGVDFDVFPAIPILNPGDTASGSLDITDGPSVTRANSFSDLYKLTLNASTAITIDMMSSAFNPQVHLYDSSGSYQNRSGSGFSQIGGGTLGAGTYYIEATSDALAATGPYTLSINSLPALSSITPAFASAGTAVPVTLAGARLADPLAVNMAAEAGSASNIQIVNSGSATATLNVAVGATPGATPVTVTTATGTSAPVSLWVFPTIPAINPGDTISGSLDASDGRDPVLNITYADLYQLNLNATTAVTIDLRSAAFNPKLHLLSPSGSDLSFGAAFSQIVTTLSAGTYYIDATSISPATGAYAISINVLPALTSINPAFATAGTTVAVTLTGTRFDASMSVSAGNATVSNLNIVSPTSATVSLTIPPGTPAGSIGVVVTTSAGASNVKPLFVFLTIPTINVGDIISGSLDPGDGTSPAPSFPGALSDVYQLSINSTTSITVEMRSTAFAPVARLYSASGSQQGLLSFGSGYAHVVATLSAGTYFVEASSSSGPSQETGAYTVSINTIPVLSGISPPFGVIGTSIPVTLTGTRFADPMTLSAASGAFGNVTVANVNVLSSTSATATINVPAGTPAGGASLTATAPGGTSSSFSYYVFQSIPSINPGDLLSGSLSATSGIDPFASSFRANSFADLYQLTLAGTSTLTIDMRSTAFNPVLIVSSSAGKALFFGNNGGNGGGYSQLTATLSAGTYYIVAAAGFPSMTGAYTISIDVFPSLASITPPFAVAGTSVPVTLTGKRFVTPMTAGAGGSFSNLSVTGLNVVSSTSATGTLNVPAGTPSGTAYMTVTTPAGSSNPVSFFVFSPISIAVGDTLSGSLTTSDVFLGSSYGDMYQLTLNKVQPVIIEMRSSAFDPLLGLLLPSGLPVNFSANPVDSPGDSRITTTLQPGTYYIFSTSITPFATGPYTLSVTLKKVHGQITSQ
jgi:hypothetical protein